MTRRSLAIAAAISALVGLAWLFNHPPGPGPAVPAPARAGFCDVISGQDCPPERQRALQAARSRGWDLTGRLLFGDPAPYGPGRPLLEYHARWDERRRCLASEVTIHRPMRFEVGHGMTVEVSDEAFLIDVPSAAFCGDARRGHYGGAWHLSGDEAVRDEPDGAR